MDDFLYKDLTYKVIGLAMDLHSNLGNGFLEAVYENGLLNELEEAGVKAESQVPLEVIYKGKVLGQYRADMIVEDKIILELKTANFISDAHRAQLIGYLNTTGYKVGLLINFGAPSLEHERLVNQKAIRKERLQNR